MAIITGKSTKSNDVFTKLNILLEDVIVEPNCILLEIPEDVNITKGGIEIISDKLNPDILYKVAKIGKNVEESFGIKENYFILLQGGLSLLGLIIEDKKYVNVEGHNIILATKKLKDSIVYDN